jgi:hypothetical protein
MSLTPPSYVSTPHVAYVDFKVQGESITKDSNGRPLSMQSFTLENDTDASARFTLQVVDPSWSDIDRRIFYAPDNKCSFHFGYEAGGVRSKLWDGYIDSVVPSFTIDGIMLTISGFGTLGKLAVIKKTYSYPDVNRDGLDNFAPPHKWVQLIADRYGLKTDIEECEEVLMPDGFFGTEPVPMRFSQNVASDLQFIKNILAPYAISKKTGRAGYVVYMLADNVLHFHPLRAEEKPKETFIYMRDPASEVLSFEVDHQGGVMAAAKGYSKVTVATYDKLTGQPSSIVKDNDTVLEKVRLSGHIIPTGQDVAMKTDRASGLRSTLPEVNVASAEARAFYHFYRGWNSTGVNAKLVIVGTDKDTVQIGRTCTVVVKEPNSVGGDYHYTTGNYIIQGKTDELRNGSWTTTLTIQREGPAGVGPLSVGVDNTGRK